MKDRDISFIERMTAGATHELLNTFAIIREASGLLEDILKLNRGELSSWEEKALEALARIRGQVARGAELSERLNSFAHGLAVSPASVELNRVLDQVAFLMQHTARIRRVELRLDLTEPSPVISIEPLRLQIVLASFIDRCLDLAGPDGSITLHAEKRDEVIAVRCEAMPPRAPAVDDLAANTRAAELKQVVDALDVRLVGDGSRPSSELELQFSLD